MSISLPYLRAYDQLVDRLPDGHIPAVVVAKLAFGIQSDSVAPYVFGTSRTAPIIVVVPSYGQLRIFPDYDMLVLGEDTETVYQLDNLVAIVDYLRELDFALPVKQRQLDEGRDFLRKA